MEEAAAAMLDMEAKLEQDDDGAYRSDVLALLDKHAGEIKSALDSGLPPEDFERAKQLQEAIEAASFVVDRVWQRSHSAKP